MHATADLLFSTPPKQIARDTGGAGSSYMVSSQDLRSGLEVRLLGVSQLPAELLRELMRLHACWQGEAGRGGRALAA